MMMKMREIREDISNNARRIKRKAPLETVQQITRLYAMMNSEKDFQTLSNNDISKVFFITKVMGLQDEKILSLLCGILKNLQKTA